MDNEKSNKKSPDSTLARVKPVRRQSCRIPMGGSQLKAALIASVIFGFFMLFAGSFVVFTAMERQGISFAPVEEVDRPKMDLKKRQMKITESSKPQSSADRILSKPTEAMIGAGEAADAAGILDNGAGYELLAEMPTVEVSVDESFRAGSLSYRKEVRLGGSWVTDVVIERPQSVLQSKPATFYAVIFRITIDQDGTLIEFIPEKIVDPRTENIVEIELSDRFIESAKVLIVGSEVELEIEDGEQGKFYEIFLYDPQNPYIAIAQPRSAEN